MNVDALPRILFLNEESQEMQDRRIRSKVEYDTSGDNPKKIVTKKINNTIELVEKLPVDNEINRLAYSSKLGILITCTEQQILLTDYSKLSTYIATADTAAKSLKQNSMAVKFSGKIYLSPDESKFLAVNKEQLMVFDLKELRVILTGKNQHGLRHFIFVNDKTVVGWNFHSNAFVYEDLLQSLEKPKKIQGVEKCTSINAIQGHIVACEKLNEKQEDEDTKLIVLDSTGSEVKNEISLKQFDNPDSYFFNYTQVISIFSIRHEKEGQFSANDVYGLVLGYYDDFEQEPDRRYLNFMKGDILTEGSKIEIRAMQLFLSPTEDRSFYYDENQNKIPFEVQILSTGSIRIILIEKLQVIYVIDSTQEFSKLNLYTLQPSHEIKLQDRHYFKGMCLMRNMLEVEKRPPSSDSNEICDMICRDFGGEFMSLYFPAKETELTVPFPASLMVLGDGRIMRRYAVETMKSIEEYETDKVKQAIGKIKTSPYVEKIQTEVKVEFGLVVEAQKSTVEMKPIVDKKDQKPAGLFVQEAPKSQSPFGEQPKEQKKSTSLFGQPTESKPATSLFGQAPTPKQDQKPTLFSATQQASSLFSGLSLGTKTQPKGQASIFDKKVEDGEKKPTSLFDQKDQKKPSLFGQSKGGSLFSSQPTGVQTSQSAGLFGVQQKKQEVKGSIFQAKQTKQQPKSESLVQTPLFATKPSQSQSNQQMKVPITLQQGSIFGQSKAVQSKDSAAKPSGGIFGGIETAGGIFSKLSLGGTMKKQQQGKGISEPLIKTEIKAEKIGQSKPMGLGVLKPKQQEIKPSVQKIQEKKQLKEKPPAVIKRAPLWKLQEVSVLMGFPSLQLVPEPLKELTEEQVDALMGSLKNMAKARQEEKPKRPQQQVIRERLLKQAHLSNIISSIDQAKQYMSKVKQANQVVTSQKIFSLVNVKKLVDEEVKLGEKSSNEIRLKNPLANFVRNYILKMEHSSNYEKEVGEYKRRVLNGKGEMRKEHLERTVQKMENQLGEMVYYQNVIYPERFGLANKLGKRIEDKWVEVGKEKNLRCQNLVEKVDALLQRVLNGSPTRVSLAKSSSVVTNISLKGKKKGHFGFSLISSSDSQQESDQEKPKPTVVNFVPSERNQTKRNILIRFKPPTIELNSSLTTPLVSLPSTSTAQLFAPSQQFNAAEMFKSQIQQPLQSSMKKSVNFNDRIPLKRDSVHEKQVKKSKTIKFDQSQELQDSEDRDSFSLGRGQNEEQDEDILPDMGRTISKIPTKPTGLKEAKKQAPLQANIPIKKTFEEDVITKQKSLADQTKQAASIFGQPVGVLAGKDKQQSKKEQKPQPAAGLFGTASNLAGLFKADVKQDSLGKEVKKEEDKLKKDEKQTEKKPESGATSLFGAASTAATLFTAAKVETKPETTKKQQKPTTIFGNVPSKPSGSLFGIPPKQQPKKQSNEAPLLSDAKKQELKIVKAQQPTKKQEKPATSLFGNLQANQGKSLFGSNQGSSLFGKPQEKKQAEVKKETQKAQSKPSEPVSKVEEKATEKKQDKKPGSLFANVGDNKGSLFGTSAGPLFGAVKKQQPKKQQKQTKNQVKGGIFGQQSGGLFGAKVQPKGQETKQKNQAGEVKKPQKVEEPTKVVSQSLFGSNIQQPKAEEKKQIPQQTKPQIPAQQPQNVAPTASQTQSLFGGQSQTLFGQQKPAHQVFGSQNRFLGGGQQQPQGGQSTSTFNPSAAMFGGNTGGSTFGFGQSSSGGMKSFASFGDNKAGGLFGQGQTSSPFGQNQPQPQSSTLGTPALAPQSQQPAGTQQPAFGNQGLFGQQQQQAPMFGQQQQSTMFGQQQQAPTFGQQPASGALFGQGGGSNFLSGFNPGAVTAPSNVPSSNPSMLKPRK